MNISVTYKSQTLASATQEDFESNKVLQVEGNYYFDTSLINEDILKIHGDGQQYTCPIKQGTCDYYNIVINGEVVVEDAGWIYEKVENGLYESIEGKIAFYQNKVTIDS